MAIDPPYRFDPFQNLVNVHWYEPITGLAKYFVFKRGPGDYGLPNNCFYPVDDSFWSSSIASGEGVYQFTVIRTLLSEGLSGCLTLGDIEFFNHWQTINGILLYPLENTFLQPARNTRPFFDYYFIGVSYTVDDTNPGDWPPPFEPLPP